MRQSLVLYLPRDIPQVLYFSHTSIGSSLSDNNCTSWSSGSEQFSQTAAIFNDQQVLI